MDEATQAFLEKLLSDSSFRNWAKNSNENDVAFWNTWIKDNPDKIDVVYNAKDIVLGIAFQPHGVDETHINKELDAVLGQIQKRAQARDGKPVIQLSKTVKRVASLAAVGLILMLVALNFPRTSDEIVHKTGFGEVINLKLPDGTSVVLNGNSEIRYGKKNTRDVTLKGEAYFKVKPQNETRAKFWVNTEDLRVEVYGTQFHVNTRDSKTDVTLDEGSINLLLKNGIAKKMLPGEYVSYSNVDKVVLHEGAEKPNTYLWREGTYVFNNISLKEVMKHLGHTYGLPAEFMDKTLEGKTLTGGIPNENLKICLSAIEKTTGTRIVQQDNKLIIYNDQ